MADKADRAAARLESLAAEDELSDLYLQAATYRERYAAGTATRLLNVLADAEASLEAQLRRRLERLSAADRARYVRGRDLTTARLVALLEAIRDFGTEWRRRTAAEIGQAVKDLAAAEIGLTTQALALQGVTGAGISTAQVVAATYAQPLQGRHLRDLFRDTEPAVKRTVERVIRSGFVTGQTTEDIVRTLMADVGSAGIAKHRRGVTMIARTALTHTAARSTLGVLQSLGHDQVILVATLDSSTSGYCRSIDGLVQRVDAPKLLAPPFHPNCRTALTPHFADSAVERAAKGSSGPGPVPGNLTYGPWLRRQSKRFIYDTLGPTRGKLFLDGGLSIEKFSDIRGLRALTNRELENRYRSAWERAGLARAA